MKISCAALLLTLATGADAYQPQPPTGRRAFLNQAAWVAAGVASTSAGASAAHAMEACPKGSNNCIRTVWTPPEGTSESAAAKTVLEVLNSYPQEGQDKVDKGGYTIVSEFGSGNTAAVEYQSGIGNFAKFLNGGKPFVDDLKLEIGDNGVVQVRSSSRVGDSDFNVNQKRLQYLGASLRSKGWTVPEPTY